MAESRRSAAISTESTRVTFRRQRWFIAIAIVLSLLATFWAVDSYLRYRRMEQIADTVRQAGGKVRFPDPIWQQLWARWQGQSTTSYTAVGIVGRTAIDDEWLRKHDYLRELNFTRLKIMDSRLTGAALAQLVELHTLEEIDASNVTNIDAAAAAFGASQALTMLHLEDSDLSDDGFRRLPLERLHTLTVADTDVTPAGLQELRRCQKLSMLTIDGRQFTDDVAEMLRELGQLETLVLSGPSVTDEHLQVLRAITCKYVALEYTGATPEGIEAVKVALPGSKIIIFQ